VENLPVEYIKRQKWYFMGSIPIFACGQFNSDSPYYDMRRQLVYGARSVLPCDRKDCGSIPQIAILSLLCVRICAYNKPTTFPNQ
jgi:hypothetical protein